MDENLINQIAEDIEIQELDDPIENVNSEIQLDESIDEVVIEQEEDVGIDISESVGWVRGDSRYHDSLLGIEYPNQHPIEAITGLREELDDIEKLQSVFSNHCNVANYYKWKDVAYDEYGYFVSFVPEESTIRLCSGEDIIGVSVDSAGFIGGQSEIARDNTYGLIVTSGLVYVRSETGIKVGDYVVCNASGYAKKSDSNFGYRVLHTKKDDDSGTEYVFIALGVQGDVVDKLAQEVMYARRDAINNTQSILATTNLATKAYEKAYETSQLVPDISDQVHDALKNVFDDLDNVNGAVLEASIVSKEAKDIATAAQESAAKAQEQATDNAKELWSELGHLQTDLSDTEAGFSTAIRTDRDLRSLVVNIDKYSVGEYSQAYGLTLEQAKNILDIGMIYVPTSHEKLKSKTEEHEEEYIYTINGDIKKYKRCFTPGFVYRWDAIQDQEIGFGWKTIGIYSELNTNDSSNEDLQDADRCVVFSVFPIDPPSNFVNYYWFAQADPSTGKTNPDIYTPNTLYKYVETDNDDNDSWVAVAKLESNVNTRLTNTIAQTANEIDAAITNAYGSVAGFKMAVSDTASELQTLTAWKNGDGNVGEAIIKQIADDDGNASIVISTYPRDVEGNIDSNGVASLVLSSKPTGDDSGSFLAINANNINFDGQTIDFSAAESVNFGTPHFDVYAEDIKFQIGGQDSQRNLLNGTDGFQITEEYVASVGEIYYYVKYEMNTDILGGVNYVFSADISFSHSVGKPQDMYVLFYNDGNKTTAEKFSIDDQFGHISGVLTSLVDVRGPLVIYNKYTASPTANWCTLSNVKLEKEGSSKTPSGWDDFVVKDGVVASINAAMEDDQGVIEIKSNKLSIESDNFKLGSTGEIEAKKGLIAGWTIDEFDLYGKTAVMTVVEPSSFETCTGSDSGHPGGTDTIITNGAGNNYYIWYEVPDACRKAVVQYSFLENHKNFAECITATNMTNGLINVTTRTITFDSEDYTWGSLYGKLTIDLNANTRYVVFRFSTFLDSDYHHFKLTFLRDDEMNVGLSIGDEHKKKSLVTNNNVPVRFYVGEGSNNTFAVLADGSIYSSAMNAKGLFQTLDYATTPALPTCYINSIGNNILFAPVGACSWLTEGNSLPTECSSSDALYVGWNLSLGGVINPSLVARPVLYNKTTNAWYRSQQIVTLASIESPTNLWGDAIATVSDGESTTTSYAESSMGGAWSPDDINYRLN